MLPIYKYFLAILTVLITITSFAQNGNESPYELELSTDFTTILIFPAPIIPRSGVDLGSSLVRAKSVGATSNVLKVKAASKALMPTNVTVFTTDGRLYRFQVAYKANPVHTYYDFTQPGAAASDGVRFNHERMNDAAINQLSHQLTGFPPRQRTPKSTAKGGIRMQVSGTYLLDGVLFFQIRIMNVSAIPFDIDFTRSYIRDRKRAKRTSVMQQEVRPLAVCFEQGMQVNPANRQVMVLALEKFTIADNKYFVVELYEKNGDRHLTLRLKGKHLLRAKPLLAAY